MKNHLDEKILEELVLDMSEESARSALAAYTKVHYYVSSSWGYALDLEIWVKKKSPFERVFSKDVGVSVRGGQLRSHWDENELSLSDCSRQALSANLMSRWSNFESYMTQKGGRETLISLVEGFQLMHKTLVTCNTCTKIIFPVENMQVNLGNTVVTSVN
ncbi:MAG: hypothetical protein AB8G77_07690 [Rhodothermales bacterium]